MKNEEIAAKIKALCKEKGIAQKDLLDSCDLSRGFIYDLEKRGSSPSISAISAIASYLNVSIDFLVGNTPQPDETFIRVTTIEKAFIEAFRASSKEEQDRMLRFYNI